MEMTYHGLSCVRVRGRDVQLIIDPLPGPSTGKLVPDLVVRTAGATDAVALRSREGASQAIAGPGEYEIAGVSVRGIPAGEVTVMRIEVDDLSIVALGRLDRPLTEDEIDTLGHIDVLVVPVGGGDALTAAAATKLVNALSPSVVVPVRFRPPGLAVGDYGGVETFAKEMGLGETVATQPKLTLTGSIGAAEHTRVVILDIRG